MLCNDMLVSVNGAGYCKRVRARCKKAVEASQDNVIPAKPPWSATTRICRCDRVLRRNSHPYMESERGERRRGEIGGEGRREGRRERNTRNRGSKAPKLFLHFVEEARKRLFFFLSFFFSQ